LVGKLRYEHTRKMIQTDMAVALSVRRRTEAKLL
jgi:hypothetical protein